MNKEMSKDFIKLTIFYTANRSSQSHDLIATEDEYKSAKEQWSDVSLLFITVKGRINDVDSNIIESNILRDAIIAIDKLTINGI